ncbi:MAG: hypothetical protein SFY32_05905 [Bacteroidota bacterium]|nr:hypothetical protein [Bacteroidota bacterium]
MKKILLFIFLNFNLILFAQENNFSKNIILSSVSTCSGIFKVNIQFIEEISEPRNIEGYLITIENDSKEKSFYLNFNNDSQIIKNNINNLKLNECIRSEDEELLTKEIKSLLDEHFNVLKRRNKSLKFDWYANYDFSNKIKYNLIIFSDLYGLSPEQPNGLIQPRAYFSFPIIRRAITGKNGDIRIHFLRNVIFPDITLSKVEDKLRVLPSIKNNTITSNGLTKSAINMFDIMQYAYLNTSLKVNIITLSWPKHKIYLDAVSTGFFTNIYDSSKSNATSIFSYGFGGNIKYATNFEGRLNLEIYYSGYWMQTATNDFKIYKGPQYKDLISKQAAKLPSSASDDNNVNGIYINSFNGQLNIYDKEKKDNLFFRIAILTNADLENNKKYINSFWQIQVGYSKKLEDIFKVVKK